MKRREMGRREIRRREMMSQSGAGRLATRSGARLPTEGSTPGTLEVGFKCFALGAVLLAAPCGAAADVPTPAAGAAATWDGDLHLSLPALLVSSADLQWLLGSVPHGPVLQEGSASFPQLDMASASNFARLALDGLTREYPNKLDHVMNDASEVSEPGVLHPVFFGSYDWHSCVHGHWMLVRLLRLFPELPEAEEIRGTLGSLLTPDKIAAEVAYLAQPGRASFERTYGWAWLLKLSAELRTWDDPQGARWAENLQPLADAFAQRYMEFLPKQDYPIRRGVHPNTAFGLALALDYARVVEDQALESLLVERATTYFARDQDYPAQWEPDGDDFLSRSLIEADLMRRVLAPDAFRAWFHAFLPGLPDGRPASLLEPAEVSDRSDPKIVHLDGLNLSRAWCMRLVAEALPEEDPVRAVLLESAAAHARATLPHVASGNYEGEHWLGTFAVFMMTEEGG